MRFQMPGNAIAGQRERLESHPTPPKVGRTSLRSQAFPDLAAVQHPHRSMLDTPLREIVSRNIAEMFTALRRSRATISSLVSRKGNQNSSFGATYGRFVRSALRFPICRAKCRPRRLVFQGTQWFEGAVLEYEFHGVVDGDSMTGKVQMGEYGVAEWTAKKV